MLIDWFTVVAQAINFVILVVALKYLLYDRITEAMEKRRQAISTRERAAEEASREAEEARQELERERRELEARREEMLAEAGREASQRKRELLAGVRGDVERQEEEWRESVRLRQERLLGDLQRLTGEKAISITERLLHDLVDESMERALIGKLTERIGDLPEEERNTLADALRSDHSPILVRGAFDLSEESRQRIRHALEDLAGDLERDLTFQHDPDLIAGIVIQAGPQTVGWTMGGYLEDLEKEFADVLRGELRAAGDGEGGPGEEGE